MSLSVVVRGYVKLLLVDVTADCLRATILVNVTLFEPVTLPLAVAVALDIDGFLDISFFVAGNGHQGSSVPTALIERGIKIKGSSTTGSKCGAIDFVGEL